MQLIPEKVYQRVVHNADRDERTGCLVSRYSVGSHGYAQIGWKEDGKYHGTLCHLAVWRYINGPTSAGQTVDHEKCRNRRCVEITHLRLLSNYENARRTNGRDWPLGQCINGHDNCHLVVRKSSGRNGKSKRVCLLCEREWRRRYRAKKRLVEGGE